MNTYLHLCISTSFLNNYLHLCLNTLHVSYIYTCVYVIIIFNVLQNLRYKPVLLDHLYTYYINTPSCPEPLTVLFLLLQYIAAARMEKLGTHTHTEDNYQTLSTSVTRAIINSQMSH